MATTNQKQANAFLRNLYLDYANNYLTVEKFAEHNELHVSDAVWLLAKGKELHEEYVKLINGALFTLNANLIRVN